MSSRAITPELYEQIVAAFREPGTSFKRVARTCRVTDETAAKAYKTGWPKKNFPPVQKVLMDEQLQARAKIQAEQAAKLATMERERAEARKQAVEARAQEGQIVQMTRANSLQAVAVSVQLLAGARRLAGIVKAQLEAEAAKAAANPADALSPGHILTLLGKVTSIADQINRTAHQAMTMERLHLGKPTEIIGLVDEREDMTMEEARLRIEAAKQALDSAQRATQLTVIEGGAANEAGDEIAGTG